MVDPRTGKFDNLPHIGPGNIESFTGQFYDNIKKVGEENLISGKFHFYPGDIIYGKINPQLGKYVFPLFEGLSSADSYVLNSKNGLNQKFLFTLLQTNNFYKYTVTVSMRSGMPKINRDELNSYEFNMPDNLEQEKIGTLFSDIDNLITLHHRKYTYIFYSWEQRKWIDTVNISNEMVDPRTGKFDNLPHIGPGNIESFTGQFYDNIKKVGEENLISGKFHFYPGDIIYGKINPQLGKYVFPLFEGLSSADSYVLNSKNGLNQKFLFTLLQTNNFYKYTVTVSMRSGMPKINRDELNSYEFNMPDNLEQEKIGTLFSDIDNLITLHQHKELERRNDNNEYLRW